jgi:predicted nucleic acid binding AN1-type Zn finger protein
MEAWGYFSGPFPAVHLEVAAMPEPVRCDVCGKLYSSAHLSSHKRLAHAKPKPGSIGEEDQMKTILELYKTLSREHKRRLLVQLAADEQEPS